MSAATLMTFETKLLGGVYAVPLKSYHWLDPQQTATTFPLASGTETGIIP